MISSCKFAIISFRPLQDFFPHGLCRVSDTRLLLPGLLRFGIRSLDLPSNHLLVIRGRNTTLLTFSTKLLKIFYILCGCDDLELLHCTNLRYYRFSRPKTHEFNSSYFYNFSPFLSALSMLPFLTRVLDAKLETISLFAQHFSFFSITDGCLYHQNTHTEKLLVTISLRYVSA